MKKRNPQDLTLRNLRSLRKDLDAVKKKIKALDAMMRELVAWAVRLDKEINRRKK